MQVTVLYVTLFALLAGSASAYPQLPEPLPPLKGTRRNRLLAVPIKDSIYDGARTWKRRGLCGRRRAQRMADAHTLGAFWGSYRCEEVGKDSASLHAENRAIDGSSTRPSRPTAPRRTASAPPARA